MSKWTKWFIVILVCIVASVIVITLWPKNSTEESKNTEASENSDASVDTGYPIEVTEEGIQIQETLYHVDFSEGPSGYTLYEFSSKKFTGTYVIFSKWYNIDAWICVNVMDFYIKSGEFHYYVKFNDEIIGELQPNSQGMASFSRIFDEAGALELVIVGNKADFTLKGPKEMY